MPNIISHYQFLAKLSILIIIMAYFVYQKNFYELVIAINYIKLLLKNNKVFNIFVDPL